MDIVDAFLAVANEDTKALRSVLEGGVGPDDARNSMGRSLLGQAACGGNADLADVLIEHGADVESREEPGQWTVMTTAALFGHAAFLRRLLDAGADPNAPATRAELSGSGALRTMPEILSILNHSGAHYLKPLYDEVFAEPLFKAVESGKPSNVQAALDGGANPNAPNPGGITPLKLAASFGNTEVGAILIDAGAEIDAIPSQGATTALMDAAAAGHVDFVELLIDRGADVNAEVTDEFLETSDTVLDFLALNPKKWLMPVQEMLARHGAVARGKTEPSAPPARNDPSVRLQSETGAARGATPRARASALSQNLEVLIFQGIPVGFFFRYGLSLWQEGSEYGLLIVVAAFVVGALFVFPTRPFWQPVLAVAVGIGLAEFAGALTG